MGMAAPPIYGDPTQAFTPPSPLRAIASFWRRLAAFLLDALIVGVAAFVVTIPFVTPLSRLGPYGRVLGLALALPYYAVLNSRIGNGQTFGKRILHIQVVDEAGRTLSFSKSLIRYFVLAIPYFLSDPVLPATRTPWLVSTTLSALGIVSAATLYLMVFNRHSRQGVHDLAAGSFVVSSDLGGPPEKAPIWKAHWAIFAAIVIVFFVSGRIIGKKISKWAAFPQLLEDARLLENMDGVQSAGVMEQWSATLGREQNEKSLVITIHWDGDFSNKEAVADQFARTILLHDSTVQNFSSLRVVIVRGYDLGIAHFTLTNSFAHPPNEWRTRLFGSAAPGGVSPTKL